MLSSALYFCLVSPPLIWSVFGFSGSRLKFRNGKAAAQRERFGPHIISRGRASDSVKRHLRGCHLSVLNLKFDFISDGGCTREEQIALSLKRHLFPHGGREPNAFWICFSRVRPPFGSAQRAPVKRAPEEK